MAHPTLGQIHAHVLQRRTTPEGRSVALQGRSDAKWLVALYPAFPTRQPKFLVCSQFVTSVCVKSNSSAVGSVAPKQHCPFASSAALTLDMIGRTSAVDRLGVPSLRSIATNPQCRRRVPKWLVIISAVHLEAPESQCCGMTFDALARRAMPALGKCHSLRIPKIGTGRAEGITPQTGAPPAELILLGLAIQHRNQRLAFARWLDIGSSYDIGRGHRLTI